MLKIYYVTKDFQNITILTCAIVNQFSINEINQGEMFHDVNT